VAISISGVGLVRVDTSWAAESENQQVRLSVSISRAPLNVALRQLARQFGIQVGDYSDDVGATQIMVGPLSGAYSCEESLELLLRGTDLTYRFVNDHTVAIIRRESAESAAMSDETLPEPPTPEPALLYSTNDAANQGGNSVKSDNTKSKHPSLWSRILCAVILCGAASLPPGEAHGQDAVANGASQRENSELDEIVVTAERRKESIDTTPIAITAVSGEQLEQANVVNAVQLQYLAPSMQVTQTGQGIERTARIYGDVGVTHGLQTVHLDTEVTLSDRYMGVYVKRDGRWQLVGWQSTALHEPDKKSPNDR